MPGYDVRYWAERTPALRRRSFSAFRGEQTADVVVIGGGLTGCATAYALAAAGLDVVLLEAERLAGGATARGTGAVVPEPDVRFRETERTCGRRIARGTWKATARGAAGLASTLRRLKIRCDLDQTSLYIDAPSPDAAAAMRREQTARRGAGLTAPWLAPAAMRNAAALDSFGALSVRGAFTFDPVRAALGLAHAAAGCGARICERSPVVRTRFTRKRATVVLPTGRIETRGIVVATGEPGALYGQLRRHVRQLAGYVVVTHPMPAAMRKDVGRRDGVLTELIDAPHWLRWLPDERILFAGALGRPVPARQRDKALVQRTGQLMYELSVRYPAISGLPAAWSWDVPVVSGRDGLPWIGPHRNYPFHFFALAFGWQGASLSWLAARAAVRHFRGNATPDDRDLGFARYL